MSGHFFKYLEFQKRVSPHTLSSYQNDLNEFSAYLNATYDTPDPSQATYPMIRSWIIQLSDNGLKPSSINRKIACLRSFYKFLMKAGLLSENPVKKIRALKTSKRLPVFVHEKEMENLPAQASASEFETLRDNLILEFFYATGIRLSELIGLKNSAIDLTDHTIKVLGKRNKERLIPFPKTLIQPIKTYTECRNRDIGKTSDRFFVTKTGSPCYPMLVYRIVRRHLHDTSVEKKSPHVLRHTYATHLLNKGAEIKAVKDLLGHSNLAATQVYTHNSMEKIKKAYDQAHPKA